MASRFEEAKRERDNNDPPIEVGQFWSCRNAGGEVMRRIRILARHPYPSFQDRGWIYEEHSAKLEGRSRGELGITPEFNLRYVFDLEE